MWVSRENKKNMRYFEIHERETFNDILTRMIDESKKYLIFKKE